VTHNPDAERFLRAAVKTGLRLQRSEAAGASHQANPAGLQTLQRIKASLRKRTSKSKSTL